MFLWYNSAMRDDNGVGEMGESTNVHLSQLDFTVAYTKPETILIKALQCWGIFIILDLDCCWQVPMRVVF